MSGFASPNHTQTPNELFDLYMPLMHESELKVVMAIVRKTLGYKKDRDPISISQLEKMTGLSRQGVLDGAQAAIDRGLVAIMGSGKRGTNIYGLVYTVDQSTEETRTSQHSRPELVNTVDTQKKLSKRNSPKETKTLPPSQNIPIPVENAQPDEKTPILEKSSGPKEKGSGEKEKAVQPHVALIEAYHWSLPDDVRPPGKPSISRHSEVAVGMVRDGITPYDVVRYVTLTYPGYRRWAESKSAKSLMSFEHVNQYIKGSLKAMKGIVNEPRASDDKRSSGGDSPSGESGASQSLSAAELFPGIDDPERVARFEAFMRTVQGDGVLRSRKAG